MDRTRELVERLQDLSQSGTRDDTLGPIEITVAAPGRVTLDTVEDYERIGVSRLVVGPDNVEGDAPDRFIADEVLAHQPSAI